MSTMACHGQYPYSKKKNKEFYGAPSDAIFAIENLLMDLGYQVPNRKRRLPDMSVMKLPPISEHNKNVMELFINSSGAPLGPRTWPRIHGIEPFWNSKDSGAKNMHRSHIR